MREADYVKQLPRRLGLISLQPRPLTQFTGWHSAGKDPEPPGARALVCHGLLRLICLADFPAWGVSLLRPSLSVLFWGSACSTALSAPRTPAPRPAWGGAPSSCLCVLSRPHVGVQGGHSYAPQDSRFLDLLFCDLLPAGGSVFGLQGKIRDSRHSCCSPPACLPGRCPSSPAPDRRPRTRRGWMQAALYLRSASVADVWSL